MLESISQFQEQRFGEQKLSRQNKDAIVGRNLALGLPLVSVIITNYNYGRFLIEALSSALEQTYPKIECIIVDDASTDNSDVILEGVRLRYPQVRIISHEDNLGQTVAFRTGFAASSGDYVVFLDADDMLLPTFVETHIYAHLSLRMAVGFTSSDMLQSHDGRIVRTSWITFSDYVTSGRGSQRDSLRRIDDVVTDLWPFEQPPLDDMEARVHLVNPNDCTDWVYSPTSGNCFRRDALGLLLGDGPVMELRYHGDTYLNKGVCLLSGVALIDAPLTIYRIHGGNGFASHAELCGVHSAEPVKGFKAEYFAWRALVDRLIDDVDRLAARLGTDRYISALVCLQKSHVDHPDFRQLESLEFYIETRLATCADTVRASLGSEGFEQLTISVRRARKRRTLVRRRAPRRWIRPAAELCLTFGRLLSVAALTKVGDRLWHF
jgi:glycosyltransferase involved in cell wall biosynthesis